jgi:hypothetical protein
MFAKKTLIFGVISGAVVFCLGIAYAAFQDKGKVLGSTFSVGSSDIKLLNDVSGTTDSSNLADEINGPNFSNITPNWKNDYLIKLVNKGTTTLSMASHAKYLTANDPQDLRNIIFVEPIVWNDLNNNGLADDGETGVSLGRKTIVKWNTEGFDFGLVNVNETKGFVLRFSTDAVSETKQGASGIFDFEIDAVGI